MIISKHHCRSDRGVSLLLTLIIISAVVVLLTIMARLVSVDKRVSAGYSNILRAELAAKAGVADASEVLLDLFQKYPDSVTYWDRQLGATETPGTVFMFRDLPPNQEYVGSNGAAKVYARPLISGAETKEFYPTNEYAQTLPETAVEAAESTDINLPKRFNGKDEKGWIGAPPGKTTLPGKTNLEIRVPWVEITDEDGLVVSRYAYWVEDESFKLNVNKTHERLRGDVATESAGTTGEYQPLASLRGLFDSMVATSVHEARTKLTATDSRMLSPMQIGHTTVLPDEMTAEEFGREYRFLLTTESTGLDLSRIGAKRLNVNHVVRHSLREASLDATGKPDLSSGDVAEEVGKGVERLEAAIHANAPRFGQRFYRLNDADLLVPTPSGSGTAAVVSGKNSLDVLRTALDSHEEMYVRKVAANLFDYISPSANPTVIDNGGNVLLGTPMYAPDIWQTMETVGTEENALVAVGKKRLPYFTEYMLHVKQATGWNDRSPMNDTNGYRDYWLEIDHYFEFWNMTNKDIVPANGDLGPDPYLALENQPGIAVADDTLMPPSNGRPGSDVHEGRPFEIKLDEQFITDAGDEDLIFRAGSVTVITTDPNYKTKGPSWISNKKVYAAKALYQLGTDVTCSDASTFYGPKFEERVEGSRMIPPANARRYHIISYDGRTDREIQFGRNMEGATTMKVVLGNGYGLLDAHPSLAMDKNTTNMLVVKSGRDNMYRGSIADGGLTGQFDPRGNLEPLDYHLEAASSTTATDVSNTSMGRLNGQAGTDTGPKDSHLGDIAREEFADTSYWKSDRVSYVQGASTGPMVVAGEAMKSIGELGHVFDPVRVGSTDMTHLRRRRAGGRTLTVGQPDNAWDGTRTAAVTTAEMAFQTSRSRGWTAWRLADIFTVREDKSMRGDAKVAVEGLYNINGFLRDEGQSLKAFLQGVNFEPGEQSDSNLAGKTLSTSDMESLLRDNLLTVIPPNQLKSGGNALANLMSQRLRRNIPRRFSPLWERGELSQLAMFDPAATLGPLLHTGVNANQVNDRGREEIFRRLVDMITTKGSTYSVYVVGQALNRLGNPISTKAQRVTVRLHPVFDPVLYEPEDEYGAGGDNFDPTDVTEVEKRFRAPDAWTVEIVNVEDA